MGASEQATTRLAELVRLARNKEERDFRLEQMYDVVYRATEWDARQWGIDPDAWMGRERNEMSRRAASTHQSMTLPTEPMMRVRTDAQMVAETGEARRHGRSSQAAHVHHDG